MKNVNGIQTPFEDAIMSPSGGKGDMASSDPGVPVRDGQGPTQSVVGPMALTTTGGGLDKSSPSAAGKSIKGS